MLKVEWNNWYDGQIMLSEGTAALLNGPMVRINQIDPIENKPTVFDSIYLSKNTVIQLAAHFIQEGANADLSYEDIKDLIRILQEKITV